MKKTSPLLICFMLVLSTGTALAINTNRQLAQVDIEVPPPAQVDNDESYTSPAETSREARTQIQDPVQNQVQSSQPDEGLVPVEGREDREISQTAQLRVRERLLQIHARRLSRRFNFYHERLMMIGEKLEARLEMMVAEGIDVGEAENLLAGAFNQLEEAEENTDAAIEAFETAEAEDEAALRQLSLNAKDIALEAHGQYQEALRLMKEAVVSATQQLELHNQQQVQN